MPESTCQTFFLPLSNGRLFVRQWGQDLPLLIVLPGYGQDGRAVKPMLSVLQSRFTICALDLPFHGQSEWEETFFTANDMEEMIRTLARKCGYEQYSLLGHSLGGRIATCLAGQLAGQLEHLMLLAPAGIGRHTLIYPRLVQGVLEKSLRHPGWLKTLLETGNRMGLVSNFHRRYAEVHLYPPAARHRLFRVWNSLPEFQPERQQVQQAIRELSVPILLLLGRKDRIIPNEQLKTYYRQNANTTIQEIDAGHDLFIPATARSIINAI